MKKGQLHVLRSRAAGTRAAAAPTLEPESSAIPGTISENEIWNMAAFRLHDAATWMVRLATASRSRQVRTQLMQVYETLIRDEGGLIRRAHGQTTTPIPPAPPRPDARRRTA